MQAAPERVRIKRKRDEPLLPSFVLSSKRPALSGLSLTDADTPQQPPATTRYRLVSTVPAHAGRTDGSPRTPAMQAAARERGVGRQQSDARYRTVALRRSNSGVGSTLQHVLELSVIRRCASVPEISPAAKAHKLRPFGPPIPRSSPPAAAASASAGVDDALLEEIWRDAATASAEMAAADESPPADDAEFVYDEYSIAPAEAGESEGAAHDEPTIEADSLWWEELDAEAVSELEAQAAAEGSDSQGEQDYPDDESGGSDSEDERRAYF
jgi:hypothetical protein